MPGETLNNGGGGNNEWEAAMKDMREPDVDRAEAMAYAAKPSMDELAKLKKARESQIFENAVKNGEYNDEAVERYQKEKLEADVERAKKLRNDADMAAEKAGSQYDAGKEAVEKIRNELN